MAASQLSWPEMGGDEWVRQSRLARCRTESGASGSEGSGQSYSEGILTVTNRRFFFSGPSELDELPVFDFDKLLVVGWQRHGVFSNSLIVETPSGQRFDFRTKKLACKQIAARSHMRMVTRSRAPGVRIGPTADEVGLTAAT
jgi:hypothetical protein